MRTVELPVKGGHTTLVDEDIAERLRGKKLWLWGGRRYVALSVAGRHVLLHRLVMGEPDGMDVDHTFGRTLDNRRSQLRVCTRAQNLLNRRKAPTGVSGYRLVAARRHRRKCWEVRNTSRRAASFVGCMYSRHVAGLLADELLVAQVGPFVLRNFPAAIPSSQLAAFLERTAGRIFRVVFSRRSDGRQREMLCRTGVHRARKGRRLPFEPSQRALFSVYDVSKRAYRFIPLENVICVRFAKVNYRIVYGERAGNRAA
jgi:hypothetical protein